ncbi:MAG TPA: MarR family transcriptional regulator [Syntrophales bacterium]
MTKVHLPSPEESLGFWVYRLHIQGTAALRRAFQTSGFDLTPEQWGVLVRLREQEGINQNQLGERAFKDRHNITRILKRLERQGYVERRSDPRDRRVCHIFLTATGCSVQEELTPVVLRHRRDMVRGIPREDLAATRGILERIVGNIERGGVRGEKGKPGRKAVGNGCAKQITDEDL